MIGTKTALFNIRCFVIATSMDRVAEATPQSRVPFTAPHSQ